MLRSAAGKIAWVARATTVIVGLAIMLALIIGVVGAAFGANGQPFVLGQNNTASLLTKLRGNVQGSAMQVQNINAGTDDTALTLSVEQGEAPMRVNSTKEVVGLNADSLDGKDFSAFDADELIDSSGPLPKEATFNSEGGTLVFSTSGSGFRDSNNSRFAGAIAMELLVDGRFVDRIHITINEQDHREPFVAQDVVVGGLPAGSHTVRLEVEYSSACNTDNETFGTLCTSTNQNDRFSLTVLEIPAE